MHLAFSSVAAPGLTDRDLENIRIRATARNAEAAITGLLLYQGDTFCGVLEGSRRAVFARMEVIITDPRHRAVQIVREDEIAARRFGNWTFGSLPVPPVPSGFGRAEQFLRALGERL